MSPEQKIFDIFLNKYVNEEIMTKSEFLDAISRNNKELEVLRKKDNESFHKDNIEARRWIVGTILTVGFGLAGLMIELLRH